MSETLQAILLSTWEMYVEAALWLVVGVVAAGLIKTLLPDGLLGRWLGRDGAGSVLKAAVIGAPLPLCSCGVLPAAVGLRREGASKGATVSFLIATPETGPDSVALSYALLGPFMAVARPVAAIFSAVFSGLLTNAIVRTETVAQPAGIPLNVVTRGDSCSSSSCSSCGCESEKAEPQTTLTGRVASGLRYGFTDIMDDIALWLVVGLVLAGGVTALVEPQALGAYGSGIGAMLVMLAVGVPVYVCATASTPIAAGLMAVGVSPGAALVFLLAGPATNIATLGVVGKDLGPRALTAYLLGIALSALAAGLATDAVLAALEIDIQVQMAAAAEGVPETLNLAAAVLLLPFFARSLWRNVAH